MKKILSAVLVCAILVCSLLTLSSCGKMLYGAYKAEVDLIIGTSSVTYDFDLFGKVTYTVNTFGKETVTEGKYELNDEGNKITFTFENEDGTPDVDTYDFVTGEEGGVEYVKIGLIKYEKVD